METGQAQQFQQQPHSSQRYFQPVRPFVITCTNRVPTRAGKTGKPGKMGKHFPVREKSGNFEQTGKVREKSGKTTQNTGKLRKFQKKIICYFSKIFK